MSSDQTLLRSTGSVRFPDGSSIVRPDELEWTPWAFRGTSFKLLSVNRGLGSWSCLVRCEPGVAMPAAEHFGAAFVYVIEGGYAGDDADVATGQFSVEAGGVVHSRKVGSDGLLAYMFFMGGFRAIGGDGRADGEMVGADWLYRRAARNGMAGHIPPPPPARPARSVEVVENPN